MADKRRPRSRWDQKPYPYINRTDIDTLVSGLQAARDMKHGWQPMGDQNYLNGMMPAIAAFSVWWRFSKEHLAWAMDDLVEWAKSEHRAKRGVEPNSRQLLEALLFVCTWYAGREGTWFP